ncbi:protein polybromo-1 isoform X2 [Thrips palmi]|uniref:Protein polybromo-1 isoform X2 n=1 Tax=Thrips palmi TaxID=161013 RepID=A0A6P8ZM63_THRPL|nr:protein polybromo-1 isoform X2 [Thrips palmi]
MSKRRRTSSVTSSRQDGESECGESDSQSLPEPSARKRKKLDPSEQCQQVYDALRTHKKEDGSIICEAFVRAPKRRQEPGYYEVVTSPMDFIKIQQKIKTDEYEEVEDMTADIELMVNNAKAFYKRTSQEYKDAVDLWDLFCSLKDQLKTDGDLDTYRNRGRPRRVIKEEVDDTSEGSCPDDEIANQLEELFATVMSANEADRPLYAPFQLLPSKKHYPDYYDIISNPIDLKTIGHKIQKNKYSSLNELEQDLLLMTKNACTFNEPGSQIYKDAKTLRKLIQGKKLEVENNKNSPGKCSERIRNKRLRGSHSASAIAAALQDEDDDEDSDDDDLSDDEESDNPRWQLYQSVKNTGNNLSQPFWKLPSKRYYPDYYKEIKNPISLQQIRNKLIKGEYGTVSEVAGDLNVMFENAKKYNRPDSKLYKDAVKLQKQMQNKVQELLDFQQESDSEEDDSDEREDAKRPRRKAATTPKPKVKNPQLKKRLQAYVKALIGYCEDGRQPILLFMEKPSRKLYPDYYQVIKEPIDLLTIEANIKNEKYATEDDAMEDFKLMFNNCRTYNEDTSLIYEDANNLEKILYEKVRELGGAARTPRIVRAYTRTAKPRKIMGSVQSMKMRTLFDTFREYKDPKGRQLSVIFSKLPSKLEYPDYYEVIKRPIDLDKISQKLRTSAYENLEEVAQDLILMCDNACKYNEPDSQLYKDALMLHRLTIQTKLQLREDEESVPDVQLAVQDLLLSLFTSFYNHQDEEGRCFSDSMAELPEYDEIDGQKVRSLSLDLIKRRLDRGLYRRLDVFQTDIFAVMERARNLSRTDSQAFEDSVELQSFFIKLRDELCRGGDLLNSPALNYTLYTLADAVEQTRQQKLLQEQPEEDLDTSRTADESKPTENGDTAVDSGMEHNKQVYRTGDFVYVEPKERGMDLSILGIERMWTDESGKQMIYGNFYYRPNETYHVATRKFLEQEVFKSDQTVTIQLNEILGLCAVLSVRDYFKFKPEGFEDKDVFVCESRYSTKSRSFKKIKYWQNVHNAAEHYKFVERDEYIEPKRVISVFKDRVDKHREEIAELEENEKFQHKHLPDLEIVMPQCMPGMRYYEQINASFGILRTGDFIYIRNEEGSRLIGQVDSIARDHQGATFVRGPWLLTPREILQTPGRLFYKQELFLSCIEGVNPLQNIIGRCAVLEHQEYISSRPTEIPEHNVYICESVYDESIRQVVKLEPEGLKKYSHSNAVHEDEIYFFRRLINPPKIGCDATQNSVHEKNENSMDHIKMEMTDMMDDSLDGGPPSVGSGEMMGSTMSLGITTAPISAKKAKKDGKKLVTGYILYSSDVRKAVAANNPESSFGDVSRIVGTEWRGLPQEVKTAWEEKAAKMNEEMASKMAAAEAEANSTAGQIGPNHIVPVNEMLWECCWDTCDFQFEDIGDCIDHCVGSGMDPTGHVHTYFANQPAEAEWQCQWKNCGRIKKGAQPFPNLQRLARHVKEVHIQKSTGRIIPLHERSKNFVISRKPRAVPLQSATLSHSQPTLLNHTGMSGANHILSQARNTPSPHSQHNNVGVVHQLPPKPVEALFVSVPPKPQRLLHSEAYIKYIEGLSADSRSINNWEKQLKARPENTPLSDQAKLPGHWLANGVGNHGTMVNALWTLRDFMVRDALGISKLV